MLNNKIIGVVIPAYNEEEQIGTVLETIPDFVDRVIVVNDNSRDGTADKVLRHIENDKKPRKEIKIFPNKTSRNKYNEANIVLQQVQKREINYYIPSEVVNKNAESDRIILVNNRKTGGVGASIARGYKWCLDHNIDCAAVMAGDGQMDPAELESIVAPIVKEEADYVKGNRLIHRSAWLVIPKIRYFGNSILTILTKVASGYWRISDTQCGYTAISLRALRAISIHKIYRRYGMPNDLLVRLNIAHCTLKEVEVKPIYGIGEKSKMNILMAIPAIAWLLFKSFLKRLWIKYLFRDFHPLFLLYNFSFLLGIIAVPYGIKIVRIIIMGKTASYGTLFAFLFLSITCFQSMLFAMWMDMQDNERLYK